MNFKFLLVAILLFCASSVIVQGQSKYSPLLTDQLNKRAVNQESVFIVAVKNQKQFSDSVQKNADIKVVSLYEPAGLFFIKSTYSIINSLSRWDNILFIDLKREPVEELFTGTIDNATNAINKIQNVFPAYNGNGIILGIKENNFDTTDIDFKNRFFVNPSASATVTSHASVMGTIAAGGGNSWYATKAAAWGAKIVSSSFANLLPDNNNFYQQYSVSVQNHSYGTGIENYYGAEAMAFDLFANNNPSILPVFSSGNSGTQTSPSGIYNTINGFANLTGNFKMAKNIITVGATDSFYAVAPLSSKGPAYDGRIKPEMVALGEDGSSGAAALVSGVAVALQHANKALNNNLPSSTLIKAILINSADDIGTPEVDYRSGFGSLNAFKAMQTLTNGNFISGSVVQSQTQNYNLSIPPGIQKIKITITWNDPSAVVNASKAAVNDLDIELINSSTFEKWQPWVLSSFPHIDSLLLPAKRRRDSLNTIEQITIDNPVTGNYLINVNGNFVSTASQSFSIVWQMDTDNNFEWNYPTQTDPVLAGEQNILRWKSAVAATTGSLQFSSDNGNSWQLISSNADLSKGYFKWNAPVIYSKALLKITTGINEFVSDTFIISKPLALSVGFNCTDSFMLYWKKIGSINRYQIYKLGNQYLEPMFSITDTSVVLHKNINKGLFYAVAPVLANKEGVKSFTINYTTQGVQCFIKSFFVEKINNTALVHLQLGALYGLVKIGLQKIKNSDTLTIQTINSPNSLDFIFTDNQLLAGLTQYRIYLETTGGTRIYSDIAPLYFATENELFVYPNPVKKGTLAMVVLNEKHTGQLQLTDLFGRIIQSWLVTTDQIPIPTARLQSGIYLLRLADFRKKIKTGSLIVY